MECVTNREEKKLYENIIPALHYILGLFIFMFYQMTLSMNKNHNDIVKCAYLYSGWGGGIPPPPPPHEVFLK